MLLDRAKERAAIDAVIDAVSSGHSRVLVFSGEAGMGKTSLLKYAVESAPQFDTVWIAGIEAESHLGFAALDRLLRPLMPRLDQLPDPQRNALKAALGLIAESPADRFLVGLACLSVLADVGSERGLLCVIDDAQWIDRESLEALSFVARRLDADRVALLFGLRNLSPVAGILDGLPTSHVDGLPFDVALELLSASVDTPVESHTARRIVEETGGCPLALIELATGLTKEQLRGGDRLGEVLPIGRQLENHFLKMVRSLDEPARTFLLVTACETSGELSLVRRVAFELGADADAEDAAVASGLVVVHPTVSFRHPCIRAAIYSGAPRTRRDQVHLTLARLIDRTDPDRRVRHLAAAAREPDSALAVQLEQAAQRSARRGGYAAEAQFLFEAAQLSPESEDRGRRFLLAAIAARNAGLLLRSDSLLEQARPLLTDPLLRAEALRLDGRLRGRDRRLASGPALLYEAAMALQALQPELATDTFLEALEACHITQQFTEGTTPVAVARAALSSRTTNQIRSRTADLLLEGMACLFMSEFESAMRALRDAAPALRTGTLTRDQIATWFHLVPVVMEELHDYETCYTWVHRVESQARTDGALVALQFVLLARAALEIRAGHFQTAEKTYDEIGEVSRLIGLRVDFWAMLSVQLYAWRGQESEVQAAAKSLREMGSAAAGAAFAGRVADHAVGTLELGMARYAEALEAVAPMADTNMPGWTCLALPIAIESAARSGRPDLAEGYLEQLRIRTEASGTNWALGQLARCRALLAGSEAERFHEEAVRLLATTSVVTELAQAHLGYGEWLRREGRQIKARGERRSAYDMFVSMGADAFASRAHSELLAAGDQVQRHRSDFRISLTAQESQAARLAAGGASNAEIAAQMFISTNTVDYHLRKVYRKLGIGSRRELSQALPTVE